MKRGDIWIAAVLLAVFVVFAVPRWIGDDEEKHAASALIEVDGELYETVALTEEPREIEIRTERGYNRLRVSQGGIQMVEADCPDQLCLGFGHVHEPHGTIVCLPNRVFVEVIGAPGEEGNIDGRVQ